MLCPEEPTRAPRAKSRRGVDPTTGVILAMRYTPAFTVAAEWRYALTGVGASIREAPHQFVQSFGVAAERLSEDHVYNSAATCADAPDDVAVASARESGGRRREYSAASERG